jgi:hypothetical protein
MLVSGQLHVLPALPPGRSRGAHQIERWVVPINEFAFLKRENSFVQAGIRKYVALSVARNWV